MSFCSLFIPFRPSPFGFLMILYSKEVHLLSKQWADICLEDEEEHEVLLGDDCEGEEELSFDNRCCLVGQLLSGKVFDFQIFQNIIDIYGSLAKVFLSRFLSRIDIQRVIDGSTWTYDRKQLLIERLKPGENPRLVTMNTLDVWVQVHELQSGFKTEWAIREVARYIGE
uniref:DUF4283 domain-containing protein n=1 Tax=Cannabis sativa TaxID=3483 RepID=A0A803PGW6_CANSA